MCLRAINQRPQISNSKPTFKLKHQLAKIGQKDRRGKLIQGLRLQPRYILYGGRLIDKRDSKKQPPEFSTKALNTQLSSP